MTTQERVRGAVSATHAVHTVQEARTGQEAGAVPSEVGVVGEPAGQGESTEEAALRQAEARRVYYAQNRERILAKRREHYREHKQRLLDYSREYYEGNKDKIRAKSKRWYDDNRGRKSEYWKEYYERHRDTVLARNRARYLARKAARTQVASNGQSLASGVSLN